MHHWLLSFVTPSGPSQSSSYICCVLLARTCWSSWSIIATPPRHQKSAHSKTKFSARWHLIICKRKSFDLEYSGKYQTGSNPQVTREKTPETKPKKARTSQLFICFLVNCSFKHLTSELGFPGHTWHGAYASQAPESALQVPPGKSFPSSIWIYSMMNNMSNSYSYYPFNTERTFRSLRPSAAL